ncbi:uncharacterized protein LOC127840116 [Dreissena polymorpha]|uniref:Protein quiver n=1 Tax=Dreissena polymorpha TaxID=45954 RepID=A0A9D4J5Z8_DREPO|nr:uncharacterized protein LOC127840116 [Dreissena polymorpha]KAH3797299.1 hypothetical protein DPMN_150877 [Dreissena polymorpha]
MVAVKLSDAFAVLIFVIFSVSKVHGLDCYTCTSIEDPNCGVSFDFSGTAGDKYKSNCVGGTTACRKVISSDTHKAKIVVIRSCWNSSSVEDLSKDFLSCQKLMVNGEACYCNKDSCNGGQLVVASLGVSLLTLGLSFLKKVL